MIPKKLELTNFLSYRETAVLAFDQIQLACISGPNGAGKSTILDGITWALFGRSRSRSDDDLVNRVAALNDEAMEVRFTFLLEGGLYRIIRRKKPRKPTVLELQLGFDDDGWKTLSEGRLRETQAAIEQTLQMNYDTFTNASFLLQGKADQFTTRTANQRKEILAELLGVTEWETYREMAAAVRKLAEDKLLLLEGRLEEIRVELEQEPERRAALESAQAERSIIVEKLQLKEQLLKQVRKTAAAIEQQQIHVQNQADNVKRAEINLQQSQKSRENRLREKETYNAILENTAAISADYAAWQAAGDSLDVWQAKANSYNRLVQDKKPHELELAQIESRLHQQQRNLKEQANQVEEARRIQPVLSKKIKDGETRLLEISLGLADLELLQEKYHEAQGKVQRLKGERDLLQAEFTRLSARENRMVKLAEEKSTASATLESASERIAAIEVELTELAEQQQEHSILKGDLDNLLGQQTTLAEEMETLHERITRLQEAGEDSTCPTCGQPLTAEHRLEVISEQQKKGKERGDLFRANKQKIEENKGKIHLLETILKRRPTLERELASQRPRLARAEARLEEIRLAEGEWQAEGAKELLKVKEKLSATGDLEAQIADMNALQAALAPRKELQNEQQTIQKEVSTAKAQLVEKERLIATWEGEGLAQLQTLGQQLAAGDFGQKPREALRALDSQITAVGYDETAHQEAINQRNALAQAPKRFQELKQAEAATVPLDKTLEDLRLRIQEQESDLAKQTNQLENARKQLVLLSDGAVDLASTEDEVNELREQEITAARRVGAAQQRLAVLENQESNKKDLEGQKSSLSLRIQRLKLLETSCGRKGVQALLIEQAIPEIEERANELLDRLTGGEMRITFDTQRELKSRDALAETLDITIADNDGERPYDNYSGGEQFRVNFAIRLALSQLLAHRAGARLQTLVVDEGFGSQDPLGRQRLVEAINAVREEFACILVITHIDELRDAFPTRIEVRKSRNGSLISVI